MERDKENINELIIHYVRSRPELWDIRHKKYKDNFLKQKIWCKIVHELNVTGMYYWKII